MREEIRTNLRERGGVALIRGNVTSDTGETVILVALLICWIVVVPTAVVLLRLRRAGYAEAAAPLAPARRPCEARRRSAGAARQRHVV
jgi:hypothetical protein